MFLPQDTVDQADFEDENKNSTGSPSKVRRKWKKRHHCTVLNPYGNAYFYWLCILTICVLYNLWTAIVRQSFPELQENYVPLWSVLDISTDLMLVLDILVQYRTGYLEQGLIVYDSEKLSSHYRNSKCYHLDFIAVVPVDYLMMAFQGTVNKSYPMFRCPRFLKVYRVYNYYYMVESRTLYPNLWRVMNLVHILLLLAHWFGCFYFILSKAENFKGDWVYPYNERPEFKELSRQYLGSVYWSTLTLTTIGDLPTPETNKHYQSEESTASQPNETQIQEFVNGVNISSKVIRNQDLFVRPKIFTSNTSGMEYTFPGKEYSSVAAGGIPVDDETARLAEGQPSSGHSSDDSRPKKGKHKSRLLRIKNNTGYVFTIVSYLIGVFIFATIVGQVGNVITNRNANRLEFERLLDGAKLYMRHHKVPREMQRRVQRWYDYSWSRGRIQGGGDINSALGLLPDKLRTELALHVNLCTLKKVSIFKECQPEFLHDLVLKMKAYIFTPGDLICRKGEVAREMFIIADGILEVISETGKVLTTMKAGDFFGEIGILNLDGLNKRTADVRSVGYSELFSLSREDVLTAMKDYPEAQVNKFTSCGIETGKVLTTMKAGDFFGEIGILNLDGLNKRTADVRSVGYSELFSLSREDVLTAMKDYPEAQEILQSLGRKRLMDARHNSKSGSSSSSKHDSPSPTRENGPEEKPTKRIVSRIKSDVSAIRNAFRKSRGMTRETETVELEPLTCDIKTVTENEAPVVKRILRRFGRDECSGSSDASSSNNRGVLKRMAKVTSDETQPSVHQRTSSIDEPQGVLGAGLPLIDRLRLLKEKEEREEKERASKPVNKLKVEVVEEEPEVIGAGLPLFARLKLLKAKEDRLEREKQQAEKAEATKAMRPAKILHSFSTAREAKVLSLPSLDSNKENKLSVKLSKDEKILNDSSKDKGPDVIISAPSNKKSSGPLKAFLRKAVLEKNSNGDQIILPNASGGDQINDLNKNTTFKIDSVGNNNTIIDKKSENEEQKIDSNRLSVPTITAGVSERNEDDASSEKKIDDIDSLPKEGVQRSDSFRRAMGEGLFSSEKDMNTQENGTSNSVKDRSRSFSSTSSTSSSSSSKKGSKEDKTESPQAEFPPPIESQPDPEPANDKENVKKRGSKDEESPEDNVASERTQPKFLKVPSDETSPSLSSPESSDTAERRVLKSILKKMSNQEAKNQLMRVPDFRKLMRAPTVEGYAARRSKFNKSVSFQRKTLNSPPFFGTFDEALRRNSTSEDSRLPQNLVRQASLNIPPPAQRGRNAVRIPEQRDKLSADGMNKLLTRLGTIGTDPKETSESEALAQGVGMILQNKMADIESAWETRMAALQQEIVERDSTIRRLTDFISQMGIPDSAVSSIVGSGTESLENGSGIVPVHGSERATVGGRPDPEMYRRPSFEASNSGSDDDEPLFMRCTSIESIIHHSPNDTMGSRKNSMSPQPRSWPQQRFSADEVTLDRQRGPIPSRAHSIVDFESSTDDDVYSFSSDDEHLIVVTPEPDVPVDDMAIDEDFIDGFLDEDDENSLDVEKGLNSSKLSSKDWEVQMLAQKLADEQRTVARRVDRDIVTGKLRNELADVHSALATEDLDDLTDRDIVNLQTFVKSQRESLKPYIRLYSLEERPVLDEEFCSLYRSCSQNILTRTTELEKAGRSHKPIHQLMNTLSSLTLPEQFLLDRLHYSQDRYRRLARQRSLGDEPLSSMGSRKFSALRDNSSSSAAFRRSRSMCSPPQSTETSPKFTNSPKRGPSPVMEVTNETRSGPATVSAMFANIQRSMTNLTSSSRARGLGPRSITLQESQPILYSSR
ncbi:Ion transport domain [Trinorchestia longiramus]|nr:Ion transport domain [Trinorchestia longiramus]